MYKVSLNGISLRAPIGCFDAEQKVGNRFEVDVEMDIDCAKAAETDNLEGTVNYVSVYKIVQEQMSIPSQIMENVAYRISEALYAEFGNTLIKQIKIKVSKIAPPVGGKVSKATVEHTRQCC